MLVPPPIRAGRAPERRKLRHREDGEAAPAPRFCRPRTVNAAERGVSIASPLSRTPVTVPSLPRASSAPSTCARVIRAMPAPARAGISRLKDRIAAIREAGARVGRVPASDSPMRNGAVRTS